MLASSALVCRTGALLGYRKAQRYHASGPDLTQRQSCTKVSHTAHTQEDVAKALNSNSWARELSANNGIKPYTWSC